MSAISALPQDIAAWLNTQEALSDITFLTEFPPTKKAIPLKKAIVAVGLESVKITDCFEDDGNGVLVENEYCRLANMRLSLAIHVPFSYGGERCHRVFTTVIDCLTFASDLNIVQSGCEQMESDRNTDALVLQAWVDVEANFCPAQSADVSFASFLSKELLCGSHITDAALHVSAEDRLLWNEPIVTGGYIGNSVNSRTVTLGFQPQMVVVFAQDYPFLTVDFANSCCYNYAGIAVPGYASQGLEISSQGFRLLSSGSNVISGCTPRLNYGGTFYRYVALKQA